VTKKNTIPNAVVPMDIHLHTPASSDFQQPGKFLELLQRRSKRVDIIAFTDHNTVAGYKNAG
jgi:predicted metal-dependent phosphoesterase TrpH